MPLNLTKYFEIQSLDGPTTRTEYQRVMLVVHSLNSLGAKIAIDWPKWASASNYFGSVMRIFGTDEELAQVRSALESYVAKVASAKGKKPLVLGLVKDVPEGAKATWMFKRNRQTERVRSKAQARRYERRAIARGETPKTYSPVFLETHTLMVLSLTTDMYFPLDIQRVRPSHLDFDCAEPNTYGLGVPIPRF